MLCQISSVGKECECPFSSVSFALLYFAIRFVCFYKIHGMERVIDNYLNLFIDLVFYVVLV